MLIVSLPLTSRADLTDGPMDVLIVGTQEQVMSFLNEAMNSEFSRGVTSRLPAKIGYQTNFQGFLTGQSHFEVFINPVTNGDSLDPTGFTLGFSWKTQRGDGSQHAKSFVSTLKSMAGKHPEILLPVKLAGSGYVYMPEQSKRCFGSLINDNELAALKDKIALDSIDNTNFQMLANDSYPNDEERKAIGMYAAKREACMKPLKTGLTYVGDQPWINLVKSDWDNSDQLLLSLYKGQLTFGNFAKIRKENHLRVNEANAKIMAETKAQDAAANERAQQLAIEQQRLFLDQQKVYADLYRPPQLTIPTMKSTSCYLSGNWVNCRSF